MNIVRNIKLSKIGCYQIKNDEYDLYTFVENNLLGLKKVTIESYPDYIFYFNSSDQNIFQHDLRTDYLYVNDELVCEILEIEFMYNYNDITEFIKNIVKYAYKIKIPSSHPYINCYLYIFHEEVEKAYILNKIING